MGNGFSKSVLLIYCDSILYNRNRTGIKNQFSAKHKKIYEKLAATVHNKAHEVSIKQLLLGKDPDNKESVR